MRLTATGRTVLAALVVLYPAGVLLGYGELVALAGAATLALVLAALLALRRPRLGVERRFHPGRVGVGDLAVALLRVTNRTRLPSPSLLASDRLGTQRLEVPVAALAPGAATLVRYPLPTDRRGRLPLGPVRMVRSDPLGLIRTTQPHGGEGVLWVHPRIHAMNALPAGVVLDLEGPVSETAPRGTVTFSSLREYEVGDDLRMIHWRSTARTGTLMVRQHVDTSQPRATVVLDTRVDRWSEVSFEHGVEVAASAVAAFERSGHPIALHLVGEDLAEVSAAGAVSLLDRLAAVDRSSDPSPARLLTLLERADSGGALVVIGGRSEPALLPRIGGQRRRFAPVVSISVAEESGTTWRRRLGLFTIDAPDAAGATGAWNRLVRW